MARLSDNSSSNYLTLASAVISAYPASLACWFKPTSGNAGTLLTVGTSGSALNRIFISVNAGLQVNMGASNGSGTTATATTNAGSNGVWLHAAATFSSATNRSVYINGGDKTSNVTNRAISGMDVTRIGENAALADPPDGAIAEAAIWNAVLGDEEVAALAKGVNPRRIRPLNIVGYWPLYGMASPETDFSGAGGNMTVTGTLALVDHAPVQPPYWTANPLMWAAAEEEEGDLSSSTVLWNHIHRRRRLWL